MKARMCLVLATSCLVSMASTAFADVDFTPFAGRFSPTNSLIADPDQPIVLSPAAATAYGGSMTWWVGPRFGLEAALSTAQGRMELLGGGILELDYRVVMGDARVRFRLNDAEAPAAVCVIAGVGLTDYQNGLFDGTEGFESKSAITGIVGLGADLAVTERLKLRFDVTGRLHNNEIEADPTNVGISDEDRSQHDVVVAVGVVLPAWTR